MVNPISPPPQKKKIIPLSNNSITIQSSHFLDWKVLELLERGMVYFMGWDSPYAKIQAPANSESGHMCAQ